LPLPGLQPWLLFDGINPEAIATVMKLRNADSLLSEYNRPDSPGASVMVIDHGEIIFALGCGLAVLEQTTPCTVETNYRLASVTKQFTAMAILLLVEKGQLALEAKLTEFFPEFTGCSRLITLRHLLNHTSGLLDYEDLIGAEVTAPLADRDVLNLLVQQRRGYFSPGAMFRYSNSGYALLALIVEACARITFAQFLQEHIFGPLKMTRTLAYEPAVSAVSNRAYGYSRCSGGEWRRTDQSLTSSVLGDGGIYSSVADLYYWDQALYIGKLISRKMIELAFTPGVQSDQADCGYGFGWYIGAYRGLKEIWHSGNTVGFTTRITRFPERQFTIIILTNRTEAPLAELSRRLADFYFFCG